MTTTLLLPGGTRIPADLTRIPCVGESVRYAGTWYRVDGVRWVEDGGWSAEVELRAWECTVVEARDG